MTQARVQVGLIHQTIASTIVGSTPSVFPYIFSRIDGSAEDGSFRRLINDSETPNLNPKPIDVEGRRHVALYATCEISVGEEVAYYYGESEAYWWRKKREKKAVQKRKITKKHWTRGVEQSKIDNKDDRLQGSSTTGFSAKVDNALRVMWSFAQQLTIS